MQHDDRGVKGVSWAQNFTIKVVGVTVDLLQKDAVMVSHMTGLCKSHDWVVYVT